MAKTINVTGNVNGVGLGVQTVADALANELVNRRVATFLSAEVQPPLGSPDGSTSGGVASTARLLVSAYESEQALRIASGGPRLLPRANLPVAADTPALSASLTDPAVDADPAQQLIYVLDLTQGTDPIPVAQASKRSLLRNFSPFLRPRTNGVSLTVASSIQSYNSASNAGIDPVTGYGIYGAAMVSEFYLDGDVFFFPQQSGALAANFELYVNGSLVTVAPGTNLTQSGGRSYYPGVNGFVKVKFTSVAVRHIKIIFLGYFSTQSIRIRKTATLRPVSETPPTWAMFGDSFTWRTGASSASVALDRWIVEEFGDKFDCINFASGGTSFDGGQTGVSGTPTNGVSTTYRANFRRHWSRHAPFSVISALISVNDATAYGSAGAQAQKDAYLAGITSECRAMISEMIAHSPKAMINIFASNTGNTGINSGNAVIIENMIKGVCAEFPSVFFYPLQTWSAGPFLRGTGNTGSLIGDGNMDLYSDGLHPPDVGHRAWGEMMARRIYEAAKALV